MFQLIHASGERLKELGSIFWRCFYSVSLTVLFSFGLLFLPQAIEFLRLIIQPGWNFPMFLIAVASWSLSAWYSSRLTLGRVFEGTSQIDRSDTPFVNFMRLWLPRFLAVLPGTVLSIQFFRLGEAVFALACAATAAAIGVFVVSRRGWFASRFDHVAGGTPAVRFHSLQSRSVHTLVTAIVLTFALALAVWWQPVLVTDVLSAPVLLCFAFASWILFGDLVLTYFFKQARLPSMAALPLLLFILFSGWNDNHDVALIDGNGGPVVRRGVSGHLDAWLGARQASGELNKETPFPLFLVAAEGGGIRAAYWTGSVLAQLQDETGQRFGKHLFAFSGVSGGSLAGAVFAALMADARAGALAQAPCARGNPSAMYLNCARQVLRRDFLSPTLGYALYPDMLQRFVPVPVLAVDRARAMEQGWQASWKRALGTERLAQRFDRLWQGSADTGVPSLLLNATLVGGGNRVIASDLLIDDKFPDAYDAFDEVLDLRQMSLATAVHNSARFSYVSPAGTVRACTSGKALAPCRDGMQRVVWGRLIDGGYFENSGVETIRDLLFAMRPVLEEWARAGYRIEPVVLVISNSPGAMAPSGKQNPANVTPELSFLSELLAPPLGLFNTRAARATFAVTAERRDSAVIRPGERERFLWFGMRTKNDIPLGWALADRTFNGIDDLLRAPFEDQLPFAAVRERLAPAVPALCCLANGGQAGPGVSLALDINRGAPDDQANPRSARTAAARNAAGAARGEREPPAGRAERSRRAPQE